MDKNIILYILEGIHNNEEPRFYDFDIDKDMFGEIVETLQHEKFISGAKIARAGIENRAIFISLNHAKVELKGLNYIEKSQNLNPQS